MKVGNKSYLAMPKSRSWLSNMNRETDSTVFFFGSGNFFFCQIKEKSGTHIIQQCAVDNYKKAERDTGPYLVCDVSSQQNPHSRRLIGSDF